MKHSFHKIGSVVLILFISSLFSCTVYYTTQEVDSNLKSTVDNVNASISNAIVQVAAIKSEYNQISCDQRTPAMMKADQMLLNLDFQMTQIESRQNKLAHEYNKFTEYTKGKDKIQSGTEEWKQVKQTKANIKGILNELEILSKSYSKTANEFSAYVTNSVVPTVQYCDVEVYTAKFEDALKGLANSQKEAKDGLKNYEETIAAVNRQYSATQTQKCDLLYSHLSLIKSNVNQITLVKQNVQKAIDAFKTNTKGIKKLYSCSSKWVYVTDAESAVAQQKKDIEEIDKIIQTNSAQIQTIIDSLRE
jgi:vacuolar-type H+-ATPase subunit I/STV1